jgi:hypothetical protein
LLSGNLVVECDKAIERSRSIEEIFNTCDIVHVCIPSDAIDELPSTKALVLLHDSVMGSSHQLISRSKTPAAIVHMLMNEEQTVVVDSSAVHKEKVIDHLVQLGLSVQEMTIAQHDELIAESQQPLFHLLPLLPKLQKWADKGLLTPSGHDLLTVLHKRSQSWSPATLKSLKQHHSSQSIQGVRYNEDND